MPELTLIRPVISGSGAGSWKLCGVWSRVSKERTVGGTTLGECWEHSGTARLAAVVINDSIPKGRTPRPLPPPPPAPSPLSELHFLSISLSSQDSCHQLKLWEKEHETKAFRKLPYLNQPHRHETNLPIENCIIAKCLCIYLSVPEILISF